MRMDPDVHLKLPAANGFRMKEGYELHHRLSGSVSHHRNDAIRLCVRHVRFQVRYCFPRHRKTLRMRSDSMDASHLPCFDHAKEEILQVISPTQCTLLEPSTLPFQRSRCTLRPPCNCRRDLRSRPVAEPRTGRSGAKRQRSGAAFMTHTKGVETPSIQNHQQGCLCKPCGVNAS